MAVYKKDTITESFPACDYVERHADNDGYVNFTANEELTYDNRNYAINSAASYALSYNKCPIESYNRAIADELGHEAYFIIALSSSITAHKRDRKTYINVRPGMMIRFEGKFFTIERAPNDNLKLVMITS